MPTDVFVYGTLLFPEVTTQLGIVSCDANGNPSTELKRQDEVLLGYERFTVKVRERGNFPAIVSSPDAVNGQVLFDVTDESLSKLDLFEGVKEGYYVRKTVGIGVGYQCATRIEVEVYVCGDLIRDNLDGPWDPKAFRENELDWYLKNLC